MEDTYALLSKLVQTKSIERVLAPIAAQVSQLIIVNEAFEQGDDDAFPADLVPSATIVMRSTEGLVGAATRLAHESSDTELKREMPRACELLSVSGQNLVSATQRIQIENFSRDSRRHLIRTAKDVLEGTLKVLLVTDDAEIRKIKRSIQWVRDRLGVLTAIASMKNLVSGFKGFTESVMLLTNLIDKRQLDISQPQQREAVISAMTTLKKCVPMLNTSMQTFVKYPHNEQAKSSKLYVVGQIMSCLEELEAALLHADSLNEEYEEQEAPGHFVTNIDQLVSMLSEDTCVDQAQSGSDMDSVLEAVVRHSMAVAHFSTQHHRSLIIKNAQRLLKQRTVVSEMCKNVQVNPQMQELRADFEEACEHLLEEAHDLERHVNGAVLQLVVDIFKESREPLDRTMKAALTVQNATTSQHGDFLEPFIEQFHQHSDKMAQVSRFAAATSLDSKKVRTINTCLAHLERLDPELIPATLACRDCQHDNSHQSKASLEHLRLLKREWASGVEILIQVVDELVDGHMFLEVSETEIRDDVQRCKDSLYSEEAVIADITRSLIGRSRRVSEKATKIVDSHTDALYRNGVMAFVNQLNKVIPAVKAAANHVVEDLGNMSRHDTFHKQCDALLRCVSNVKDAVVGKNLPDLLDSVRDNVRPAAYKHLDLENELLGDEDSTLNAGDEVDPSIGKSVKEERKKVQEIVAERKALKDYISDIIHSHVSDLMKSVVSAAVAGKQKQLDLLCNSVLGTSNHISEMAITVIAHCSDDEKKKNVQGSLSELTRLTPQILDKSRKVADCDTYQVEPLHDVTDHWAKHISFLESYIDTELGHWKAVPDKLVDAAKMANVPLLRAETKYFKEHSKHMSEMVDKALLLVSRNQDLHSKEKVLMLKEQSSELENLSSMLLTMADLHVNAGPTTEEKSQLECSAREWAAKVFSITSTIDHLSANVVQSLRGKASYKDRQDFTQITAEITDITNQTMRLKQSIENALIGCTDKNRQDEGSQTEESLDALCGDLSDCAQMLTHVTQPYQTTEKMYAPHKMSLLMWQWATKMRETREMLDKWTAEYCRHMTNFVTDVQSLHNIDSEETRQPQELKCKRFVSQLRETFLKCRSKVLDAIQTSDDIDGKSQCRRNLETLAKLTDDLENAAKLLIGDLGIENLSQFEDLQRSWGIKCLELSGCLQNLKGVNSRIVLDAIRSMKLYDSSRGKSPQTPVPSYDPVNSSKFSGGESSFRSPHATTSSALTESLLDFADDLFGEDASFMANSTIDLIDQTVISNAFGSTPKDDSADKSWRNLSAGPKVQHSTPAAPSDNSGYRPRKCPFTGDNYGSPFRLPLESEKWEDDKNEIVRVARDIAQQLKDMTLFTKGQGPLTSKPMLISTAKAVAKNGEKLVRFARILVAHCVDKRIADDLQCSADRMPTIIAQLNILASVKAATTDERSTEKMLVKTAENLVEAINNMLRNAEAACVKGLRQPDGSGADETQAIVLATQWRRRFNRHRLMEYTSTTVDDLGLRKVNVQKQGPALSNIMINR